MMNKFKSGIKTVGYSAVILASAATSALATSDPGAYIDPVQPVGGDLLTWVRNVINLAIGLSALVAVGFLVYSGIQYIMSNGDESKVEKATKGIIYSVIGLVICFISVLIVNFALQYIIGV